MATLSITVPDAQVPRIVTAFEARYGPKGGLTNAQYMDQRIKAFVKSVVIDEEARAAAAAAAATAAADVETDIP